MIFYCITNVPAFFKCVKSCSGDVNFIDNSGKVQDLKMLADQGEALGELMLSGRLRELEVHAGVPEDRQKLMRHMAECLRT